MHDSFPQTNLNVLQQARLQQGEVLVQSRLYSLWGGMVAAQIYLSQARSLVWESLTDYDRWANIFPHVTKSVLLERQSPFRKRLYQAAAKKFALITIAVETELMVREYPQRRIWFHLEKPNNCFREFEAEVWLQEAPDSAGTFLNYTVQAAASLPIPAPFIQEAMRQDLPDNLLHLRDYLNQAFTSNVRD
ncbi:MAG: cyclase [Prochlorotrichaceae cyanobacterium]